MFIYLSLSAWGGHWLYVWLTWPEWQKGAKDKVKSHKSLASNEDDQDGLDDDFNGRTNDDHAPMTRRQL